PFSPRGPRSPIEPGLPRRPCWPHQLPAIARANPRVVVLGNEGGSVAGNNVKLGVALFEIVGAADLRRRAVPAIAASLGEANPIRMRDTIAGIAQRLIGRAITNRDLTFIINPARLERLGDWQFARRSRRSLLAALTLHAGLRFLDFLTNFIRKLANDSPEI